MIATAMLAEGSQNDALNQLVETFGFDPKEIISKQNLCKILNRESQGDSNYILANSLWLNAKMTSSIKKTFTDFIQEKYEA